VGTDRFLYGADCVDKQTSGTNNFHGTPPGACTPLYQCFYPSSLLWSVNCVNNSAAADHAPLLSVDGSSVSLCTVCA